MNASVHPKKSSGNHAFTLAELCAVVAVLTLLGFVFFPALANTPPANRAFQCLNNHRQLLAAWRMYADDDNDVLPPNDYPYTTSWTGSSTAQRATLKNWVAGTMYDQRDAINATVLTNSDATVLAAYIQSKTVFKCPSDISTQNGRPRVRSYSMNAAVGTLWNSSLTGIDTRPLGAPVGGGWLPGQSYNQNQTAYLTYGKFSSIIRPIPSNLFVFIDENSLTINDGSFATAAAPNFVIDYAAPYHDRASNLSFADGHAETHRWLDPRTYTPSQGMAQGTIPPGITSTPNNADSAYVASISSATR